MYDARKESATFGKIQEVCLGEHNYVQVTVPPGVWNGFMGLGTEEAIVINFSTFIYGNLRSKIFPIS